MTDYEKIEYLLNNKNFEGKKFKHKTNDFFILKDITKISNVVTAIRWKCIDYLEQEYERFQFDEDDYDEDGYLNLNPSTTELEKAIKLFDIDDSEIFFFTNVHKNIRQFLSYYIIRNSEEKYNESYEFIKDKDKSHKRIAINLVKRAISELAEINVNALSAKTKEKFESLLKSKIGNENEGFDDYFLNFTLKQQLDNLRNNEYVKQLDDFKEGYLELPKFITDIKEINFKENKLEKTIFIEGFSGSGKSTLVQNIAYHLQRENVFYINLIFEANELEKRDIKSFLSELSISSSILIIDNIHFSNQTLKIAQDFLQISDELNFYIILSTQTFMYRIENKSIKTIDKLFELDVNKTQKKEIVKIDLMEEKNLFYMIENLLIYFKRRGREISIDDNFTNYLIKNFGARLAHINLAIHQTKNIKELRNTNFDDFIYEEYKEIISLEESVEFKLLLLFLSSNDYYFSVSRNLYESSHFRKERNIIHKLISEKGNFLEQPDYKSLLFKVEDEKSVSLLFPHNAIAKYILNLICEEKNIYDLMIEKFKYVKIYDVRLYNTFFYILFHKIENYERFINIYNNLNIKDITKVLSISSLRLIIKTSFSLSIKKYNECKNANKYYELSWETRRSKGKVIRNLSTRGYKYKKLIHEENFIKLITEENIKKYLASILNLTRFDFDREYNHLMVEAFNTLLNFNIYLTIDELVYISYNLFTNSLLERGKHSYLFKNETILKLIQKTMMKNIEKYVNPTYSFKNIKKFYLSNREELYDTLLKYSLNIEVLMKIMIELDYIYLDSNQSEDYKKIIKNIDYIFCKYIHNKGLIAKKIVIYDNYKNINKYLSFIGGNFLDTFTFKKSSKLLLEAFAKKNLKFSNKNL